MESPVVWHNLGENTVRLPTDVVSELSSWGPYTGIEIPYLICQHRRLASGVLKKKLIVTKMASPVLILSDCTVQPYGDLSKRAEFRSNPFRRVTFRQ
jgi:hypothetical protein